MSSDPWKLRRAYGERILDLLRTYQGSWVSALDLSRVGGLRLGGRIHELRRNRGVVIENKLETVNGVKRSWYRLVQ